MAIGIVSCHDAEDVVRFIDDELKRSGWLEMIGVDGRDRAHCMKNAGIRFIDWVNNQVYISVYAPEFDY